MKLIDVDALIKKMRSTKVYAAGVRSGKLAELKVMVEMGKLVKQVVEEAPEIEAIPIDVLKHELAGISAADQCDQGNSYNRELERAIKTVLKWRDSPAYQMRLESMRRFGWKV